jgi:hypothetical protein
MKDRLGISISVALLVFAAPASAQAPQKPVDVTRVEGAVVELAKLKKGSAGQVSARQRAAEAAMGACRHFDTPLSDPVLQAGIDAQRARLAYDQAAYSFGSCATFNKEMAKVREFKIGGSHGVSGDYYAGKIYNDFVRYVSKRQSQAARAHWSSRYQSALDAARDQLKALGGDEGYANYFAFAFKG